MEEVKEKMDDVKWRRGDGRGDLVNS